ncbi:pyridoxal phosphate-dependent transferase [Microdochium trichocladiopsis]|uniref:Pyridoxal phosphate-dependent transferase n=1 Tax=Microdochium trichocladiopsis TaxID=1682393 RepID=A0A9P9BSR6_9PEZI|nr:pyridoxal phosphate-dependent transferase [Microdochium trichocladiopsis]KAH7035115.1 pyridoxal phosphate-dependent transferase [Microdochium trichocladiopsis]
MAAAFDVKATRAKFPALSNGGQVYLDNAGGSQTLESVIGSVRDYLAATNVQLGATYNVSELSTKAYADGFRAGARYVNAASEDEIVYGSSTTQLFRNLSYALDFNEGDDIVVSSVDHEANIAPWVDLARRQKLNLKWWTPEKSSNPRLTPESLGPLLTPRTRLVTCTHTSNILGTITDVAAIASLIRDGSSSPCLQALLCVDAVAYAPHRQIDVKALGVDFYAFSWYKVYGPHIAMLYANSRSSGSGPSALDRVRSLGHFFNPSDTLSQKLGLAGGSYELVQAIPKVAEYLASSAGGGGGGGGGSLWEGVVGQEHQLQQKLLAYLASKPDVFTVYGEPSADPKLRVPTISFGVQGWDPKDFVETAERGTEFGFRWGHFYSKRLVDDILGLGANGVVRVSMVHYNTVEEVEGLIAVLDKAVASR